MSDTGKKLAGAREKANTEIPNSVRLMSHETIDKCQGKQDEC